MWAHRYRAEAAGGGVTAPKAFAEQVDVIKRRVLNDILEKGIAPLGGHGHVVKRLTRTRCGGPRLCPECYVERMAVRAGSVNNLSAQLLAELGEPAELAESTKREFYLIQGGRP